MGTTWSGCQGWGTPLDLNKEEIAAAIPLLRLLLRGRSGAPWKASEAPREVTPWTGLLAPCPLSRGLRRSLAPAHPAHPGSAGAALGSAGSAFSTAASDRPPGLSPALRERRPRRPHRFPPAPQHLGDWSQAERTLSSALSAPSASHLPVA